MAKKKPTRKTLRSSREVADYRGVSERTVATWISEGMPRPPITSARVDNWCASNGKGQKKKGGSVDVIELQKRKLTADTEFAEIKTQLKKAELVEVEIVLARILPFLATIKLQLEQLPDRLLPYLADGAEFRKQAQREIEGLLEHLADSAKELSQLKTE